MDRHRPHRHRCHRRGVEVAQEYEERPSPGGLLQALIFRLEACCSGERQHMSTFYSSILVSSPSYDLVPDFTVLVND